MGVIPSDAELVAIAREEFGWVYDKLDSADRIRFEHRMLLMCKTLAASVNKSTTNMFRTLYN
jgi:hypothetical protein